MQGNAARAFALRPGDALVIVDVQNDFLPGGALAVPEGDQVISILNQYLRRFVRRGLPVFATRNWHPADHVSFWAAGGPWPPYCVADTPGARFPAELALPSYTRVISKATAREPDSYSGFGRTDLAVRLRQAGARRLFVGGLATDYCVLNTVLDGLGAGFAVVLLVDAIRAIDRQPGDGDAAIARMARQGALVASLEDISA